ncbi:hypothetical protein ACI48D_09795 [Massilia sp. LXY-6]|uniref:hypothetical protein n=1 Tax=Massilia sp. LXY-6 TaxID=3379823 RepID=UPI003EE3A312
MLHLASRKGLVHGLLWGASALVICPAFAQTSPGTPSPLPGAAFTTDPYCNQVNGNIYPTKEVVYIGGGPSRLNAAGLKPLTSYYLRVTDPRGEVVLGTSAVMQLLTPIKTDATGKFSCISIFSNVGQITSTGAFNGVGYATTPNNGGEYKVWISPDPNFPPENSKTDNFKVLADSSVPPNGTASITINKFYDANANGVYDPGEDILNSAVDGKGWKVDLLLANPDGSPVTPAFTGVTYYNLLPNTAYVAREFQPIETNWKTTAAYDEQFPNARQPFSTTPPYMNQFTVNTTGDSLTRTVWFGNVCTGPGNGYTLGFWSNKNGSNAIKASNIILGNIFLTPPAVGSTPLVNADGTLLLNPSITQFQSFLLAGKATNMANMLSVQLATMVLNVNVPVKGSNGLLQTVNGSAMVFAPGMTNPGRTDFISINELISRAQVELNTPKHNVTLSANPNRPYQEALKNALDWANNNLTFVQSKPCSYSFAP